MYLKVFNVKINETDSRPQKPILFYEDDVYSSALRFKIMNQSRPFMITSDCKFKLCMDTKIPNTSVRGENIIIEQDDQSLVEVNANEVGDVTIKLGQEIMDYTGKDMPMHLEIYSDVDNSVCKFKPFTISIEKNIH